MYAFFKYTSLSIVVLSFFVSINTQCMETNFSIAQDITLKKANTLIRSENYQERLAALEMFELLRKSSDEAYKHATQGALLTIDDPCEKVKMHALELSCDLLTSPHQLWTNNDLRKITEIATQGLLYKQLINHKQDDPFCRSDASCIEDYSRRLIGTVAGLTLEQNQELIGKPIIIETTNALILGKDPLLAQAALMALSFCVIQYPTEFCYNAEQTAMITLNTAQKESLKLFHLLLKSNWQLEENNVKILSEVATQNLCSTNWEIRETSKDILALLLAPKKTEKPNTEDSFDVDDACGCPIF